MAEIDIDIEVVAIDIEVAQVLFVGDGGEGEVSFDYLQFPLASPDTPNGVRMEFGTPSGYKYRSGKVGVLLNGQHLVAGLHFTEPAARLSIILTGMDPPTADDSVHIWLVIEV